MPTTEDLRGALIDASIMCAQAASGSVMSAMATAGLVSEQQLQAAQPGAKMPKLSLADAGTLAAQAAQAAAAARDLAQAVVALPEATP